MARINGKLLLLGRVRRLLTFFFTGPESPRFSFEKPQNNAKLDGMSG